MCITVVMHLPNIKRFQEFSATLLQNEITTARCRQQMQQPDLRLKSEHRKRCQRMALSRDMVARNLVFVRASKRCRLVRPEADLD